MHGALAGMAGKKLQIHAIPHVLYPRYEIMISVSYDLGGYRWLQRTRVWRMGGESLSSFFQGLNILL